MLVKDLKQKLQATVIQMIWRYQLLMQMWVRNMKPQLWLLLSVWRE